MEAAFAVNIERGATTAFSGTPMVQEGDRVEYLVDLSLFDNQWKRERDRGGGHADENASVDATVGRSPLIR